jgi:hypothetical protein
MFTAPVRYECEKLFGVSTRTGLSAGRARHSVRAVAGLAHAACKGLPALPVR